MFIRSLRVGFLGLIVFTTSVWAGSSVLQGVVKDPNGKPITNAEVRIEPSNGGSLVATAKTDANGRYVSANLPGGTYRVTLIVNGAVKSSINNAKVTGNKTTELNFELKSASASQNSASGKKAKHMVWVPPSTGSHMGGRWVEVEDGTTAGGGALNVNKVSAEQLERQAHSMGSAGNSR